MNIIDSLKDQSYRPYIYKNKQVIKKCRPDRLNQWLVLTILLLYHCGNFQLNAADSSKSISKHRDHLELFKKFNFKTNRKSKRQFKYGDHYSAKISKHYNRKIKDDSENLKDYVIKQEKPIFVDTCHIIPNSNKV